MNIVLELIIIILATYGVSNLLVNYDGYKDSFLKLRNRFQASPLHCVVCTSCWVVLPISIVFFLGWSLYLIPFAIVGSIILLEKIK